MPNLHITLPLQNESTKVLKIYLEPIPEYFFVQPGEKVVVHGICDADTGNTVFTVAPNDDGIVVYAPGEISGFVDCYLTRDGVRLKPDGH